jgi:acyl-coenzyme A thioesterase PaaI-like protein
MAATEEGTPVSETEVRRESADPYGEWAGTRGVLMSYTYLASAPRALDRDHAENTLVLRPDLRTAGGAALTAPVAIAMLDAAGINVDPVNILALTQVNVDLAGSAKDLAAIHFSARVLTEARSQIFTEVTLYDDDDHSSAIGFGSANWSVICPTPEGFSYPDPGTGVDGPAEVPPLWQAYFGERRADGLLEVPGLRAEIGTDRLHHGPMLVLTEAAALEAAAQVVGHDRLLVRSLSMTLVAPARVGPFAAVPVTTAARGDSVSCRVELRDEGRQRVVAAATYGMAAFPE